MSVQRPLSEQELNRAAAICAGLALLVALLWVALAFAGCAERHEGTPWGSDAASAQLRTLTTPSGIHVQLPGWCDGGYERTALAEVEAGVAAFSESWGSPVVPDVVIVWPLGWVAIPWGNGLASGVTVGRMVTVAWVPAQRPHLASLGHELGHVADPGAGEVEVRAGPRFVAAETAAAQAQTQAGAR